MESIYLFLKPEEGYKLGRILISTFTVSSKMAGELLLLKECINGDIAPEKLKGNDVCQRIFLQDAVKQEEKSKSIFIYAHDFSGREPLSLGDIGTPAMRGRAALLERYCRESVRKRQQAGGYFHPKVFLVEFMRKPDGAGAEKYYKMLISSKNLVGDSYFQSGVRFVSLGAESGNDNGIPVDELLRKIVGDGPEEAVTEFLADLGHVRFELEGANKNLVSDRKLFYSPKHDELVKDLAGCEEAYIFTDSLSDDLCKLVAQQLGPGKLRVVSNLARWYSYYGDDAQEGAIAWKRPLPGYAYVWKSGKEYLHSKIYVIRRTDKVIVWVGSANFTHAAWGTNAECMARLELPADAKVAIAGEKDVREHFDEFAQSLEDASHGNSVLLKSDLLKETFQKMLEHTTVVALKEGKDPLRLQVSVEKEYRDALVRQIGLFWGKNWQLYLIPRLNARLTELLPEEDGDKVTSTIEISSEANYPQDGRVAICLSVQLETRDYVREVAWKEIDKAGEIDFLPTGEADGETPLFAGVRAIKLEDAVLPLRSEDKYNIHYEGSDSFEARVAKYAAVCALNDERPEWDRICDALSSIIEGCKYTEDILPEESETNDRGMNGLPSVKKQIETAIEFVKKISETGGGPV